MSATTTSTTYSYTIDLGSGYTFQVRACNSAGCSAWKDANYFYAYSSATLTVPATDADGTFDISWLGARQSSELYEYNGTAVLLVGAGTSGNYTVTGKKAGTFIYYLQDCFQAPTPGSVKSCAKTPDKSINITAPVPAAPSAVTASADGTTVTLSWAPVSGTTYYKITRSGGGSYTSTSAGFTNNGVSPGTYTYQVQSCNSIDQCSTTFATSNQVTVTQPVPPGVPSSVSAVQNGATANVSWPLVSGATSYGIQRSDGTMSATTTSTTYSYTIDLGSGYTFQVRACNSAGCSAWKDANYFYAYSSAVLNAPSSDDDGSFQLTWSGARQSSKLYEYNGTTTALLTTSGTTGSYNVTGRQPGTYTYYVDDCYQAPVAGSTTTCAKTPDKIVVVNATPSAPPAPASITVTVSGLSVIASWSPSSGATSYELQRSSDGLAFAGMAFVSGSETSYMDSTAEPGTAYTYRVRACINTTKCSSWVTSSAISVPSIPAPASIMAKINGTSIDVSWSLVTEATKYELQRNAGALATVTGNSYTDVKPPVSVPYIYRVRACNNSSVCSKWKEASAVMIAGPGQPVTEEYEYNALGRLIRVKVDGTVKTDYQYDNAGNRKTVAE